MCMVLVLRQKLKFVAVLNVYNSGKDININNTINVGLHRPSPYLVVL